MGINGYKIGYVCLDRAYGRLPLERSNICPLKTNATVTLPSLNFPTHSTHYFKFLTKASKMSADSEESYEHGKPTDGMCCLCTMEDITDEDQNYGTSFIHHMAIYIFCNYDLVHVLCLWSHHNCMVLMNIYLANIISLLI